MSDQETEAGFFRKNRDLECMEMALAGYFEAPCHDFAWRESNGPTLRAGLWAYWTTIAFPWLGRGS